MNFVKESVNQTPIVDTVFSIVAKAKEAKAKVGSENVVDEIGRASCRERVCLYV